MPEKKTVIRAKKAQREGKAPTTQAGEFVREEFEHIREGKHGAKNAKQAIAIGLSKARRAGVKLPAAKKKASSTQAQKQAKRRTKKATATGTPKTPKRSQAKRATKRAPRTASAPRAMNRQSRPARGRRKRSSATTRRSKARPAA